MNNEKQINPVPQGKYVPATRSGSLIFTAGMTPRKNGVLIFSGKVNSSEPVEIYEEAVVQATSNALAAARNILMEGEHIDKILSLTVYVNADEKFTNHSKIADFASRFLFDEIGKKRIGSRTAVGVFSLPGNAPVEVQMILRISCLP